MTHSLSVDAEGQVTYSSELAYDIRMWMLSNVFGKTRDEAIRYLLGQAKAARSDGMECQIMSAADHLMPGIAGSCMCARLLMLLFDTAEEEVSRERFTRLKVFLGIEGEKDGEAADQEERN